MGAPVRLTDRFRDFHGEVTRLRRRILSGVGPAAEPLRPLDAGARLAAAQGPLREMLEAVERAGAEDDRADSVAVREAVRVMAVFADAVIGALDWEDRDAWWASSLELQVLGTHEGQEGVVARVERLLAASDPRDRELARVYLLALGLGLSGDVTDPPRARRLAASRERLLAFAVPRPPMVAPGPIRLTPQAYQHTASDARPRRLPALAPWVLGVAAGSLIAVVLSYLPWTTGTAGIAAITHQILRSPPPESGR